ncbi:MAG: choice-of-anchor P family protein [Thermoanaerobaculia bacterium]
MKHPVSRRTTRALALLIAATAGICWVPSIAVAQQPQPVASASAFGTFVQVEDTIVSQKSAAAGVGCALDPISRQENVAGVDVAGLLDVGNIVSTAERFQTADGLVARATSEVESIDLLGGLVGASAVRAVSVTRRLASGFNVHGGGTQFAGLVVAGIPIDVNVPPNTQVDIPLVGHVSINERASFVGANLARHRTTMLRVVVTLPILFDVGTEIVVANAQTKMSNVVAILGGTAYSTSVRVGDLSILDPSFRQALPCDGTDGQWRSNGGALVALPGVLGSATGLNRTRGDSTPTGAVATTTTTIEDADVLSGLVSADVIFGRAHVVNDGGNLTRRVFGSEFLGLSVAGFPEITDSVPLDTHLDIVGVGDLWLKRVVRWSGAIQIRMVELTVLDGTVLPVGAVVQVGVAQARALGV